MEEPLQQSKGLLLARIWGREGTLSSVGTTRERDGRFEYGQVGLSISSANEQGSQNIFLCQGSSEKPGEELATSWCITMPGS